MASDPDDEPTPPRQRAPLPRAIALPPKKRLQTATEREVESETARRRREAIPEFVTEPATGVLEGVDRIEARRRKSWSERLERVEERHDETDVVLARVETALDGQKALLDEIRGSLKRALDDAADKTKNGRERVTKVIGGLAGGGVLVELFHRFFL